MKWLARVMKTGMDADPAPTKPTKPPFVGFVGPVMASTPEILQGHADAANDQDGQHRGGFVGFVGSPQGAIRDFQGVPATLTHAQRQTITRWLVRIECSPGEIAQTLLDCEADPQALAHCLRRAADPAWLFGGREEPVPAPPPATVQACANCQHCRPAAMKPGTKWAQEARYWCSQPDRTTPGLIPARRGHGCTGWLAKSSFTP